MRRARCSVVLDVGRWCVELALAGHGRQRAFVRSEAGDHGGGIREAALGWD